MKTEVIIKHLGYVLLFNSIFFDYFLFPSTLVKYQPFHHCYIQP